MIITWPATATLVANVDDEGWAGPLVYAWEKLSGPAAVTIDDPTADTTEVHFADTQGVYIFQVTVSNDELSGTGRITVVVLSSTSSPTAPEHVLTVTIDGVERGTVDGSLGIDENKDGTPNTARFGLVSGVVPDEGNSVIIVLGATRIFGGVVLRDVHSYEELAVNDFISVNAIDQTWHMTRRQVNQEWTFTSGSDIARDIIALVPGFTDDAAVQDGLPTLEFFAVSDLSADQALNALAEALPGCTWRTDYFKDVFFGTIDGAIVHPQPINGTDALTIDFAVERDMSATVNRVKATGGGSQVTRDGGDPFLTGDLLLVDDTTVFAEAGGSARLAGSKLVTYTGKGVFQSLAATASSWVAEAPESVSDGGSLVPGDLHWLVYTVTSQFGESMVLGGLSIVIAGGMDAIRVFGALFVSAPRPTDVYPFLTQMNIYVSEANTGSPTYAAGSLPLDGTGELIITEVTVGQEPPTVDTASGPLLPYLVIDAPNAAAARQGDSITLYATAEDTDAQADLAAKVGGSDDGVIEGVLNDGTIPSDTALAQRAADFIAEHKSPAQGIRYRSYDQHNHPGAIIVIDVAAPFSLTLAFTIQSVSIGRFDTVPGIGSVPIYSVNANLTTKTLEDVLRLGILGGRLSKMLSSHAR